MGIFDVNALAAQSSGRIRFEQTGGAVTLSASIWTSVTRPSPRLAPPYHLGHHRDFQASFDAHVGVRGRSGGRLRH
jgi:hypothetical protein